MFFNGLQDHGMIWDGSHSIFSDVFSMDAGPGEKFEGSKQTKRLSCFNIFYLISVLYI